MTTKVAQMICALALLTVTAVPAASSIGSPVSGCEGDEVGVVVGFNSGVFACVSADVEYPDDQPQVNPPPDAGVSECPEPENTDADLVVTKGAIVHVGDTRVGECVVLLYDEPGPLFSEGTTIDLSEECQIGEEEGEDPRIETSRGGVGVCHRTIFDPGSPPGDPNVTTEPCPREGGMDPGVFVFGGGVTVCLRVGTY